MINNRNVSCRKDSIFLQYNDTNIPHCTMDSILNYILYGFCPDNFLKNILSGNSFVAIEKANPIDFSCFATIHLWILENLPKESYGDDNKVINWINNTDNVRSKYLEIKKQDYIEYLISI